MQERNLTPEDIKKIEITVSKGDRVEVIPVKDGVRVMRVKREDVKVGYNAKQSN